MAYTSPSHQVIGSTGWTLLATAPSFVRVQVLSPGEEIRLHAAASAPSDSATDLGEILPGGPVDQRTYLADETLNLYARAMSRNGVAINVSKTEA